MTLVIAAYNKMEQFYHYASLFLRNGGSNCVCYFQKAAEVLRTILRHCEKSTNPTALVTQPMTFYDVGGMAAGVCVHFVCVCVCACV